MREAIDSALAQTYNNCEVIVVNDGSTDCDETDRIARSYGNKIRYFVKENGGVATALNLGIRKMHGQYFSWLSHDDVYMPEKVANQVDTLRKLSDKNVILYSDIFYINANGNYLWEHHIPPIKPDDMFCFLYEKGEIHGCTLLIPKQAFIDVGVFPEGLRTTQDYELWFVMVQKFPFIKSDGTLIKSRVHDEQGSMTIQEHQQEIFELFDRHFDVYVAMKQVTLGNKYQVFRYLLRVRIEKGLNNHARFLVRQCIRKENKLFGLEMQGKYLFWSLVRIVSLFRNFMRGRLSKVKRVFSSHNKTVGELT
jgi:glycosyltransferase involved in cell wall biosynthesis